MLWSREVLLPKKITFYDYDNEFEIKANMSSRFYSVLRYACRYGGRDDLMDFRFMHFRSSGLTFCS